mgnify:CR=1 FL=1
MINQNDTHAKMASLNITVHVKFGRASFSLPENLKQKLLEIYMIPHSMEIIKNLDEEKVGYIFSNVSYFRKDSQTICPNVLQNFSCKNKGLITFAYPLVNAFNFSPTVVNLAVKHYHENDFQVIDNFEGLLTLQIFGPRV